MGTAEEPQDQGVYQFDQVKAVDGGFTLDNLAWSSCHSSYTGCVFRQTGKPTNPTVGYSGAQRLFGHCLSVYAALSWP